MAGNETSLFQLELIRRRDLSAQETNILNALACGMQPATAEAAAEAARQLDSFFPPLEQVKEANDYLWAVWEVIIDIARSPDVMIQVHERLVSILENLRRCAKGDLNVWGVSIRPCRSHPILSRCIFGLSFAE